MKKEDRGAEVKISLNGLVSSVYVDHPHGNAGDWLPPSAVGLLDRKS